MFSDEWLLRWWTVCAKRTRFLPSSTHDAHSRSLWAYTEQDINAISACAEEDGKDYYLNDEIVYSY